MGELRQFTRKVARKQEGKRLDSYLAKSGIGLTRSQVESIVRAGQVTVGGVVKKAGYRIRDGDEITAHYEVRERPEVVPEEGELDIVFEDDDLLVLDKPAGMVVHPARGNITGTLVNRLLFRIQNLPGTGDRTRPGVVHRIDKETSGLIAFAKTERAVRSLVRQLTERTMKRRYRALVWGMPKERGVVEAPVGRHTVDRKRMSVTPFGSKTAVTEYAIERKYADVASLLDLSLKTGRTHQIRVHCEYMGNPVVGDPTYGGRKANKIFAVVPTKERERAARLLEIMTRQALHAYWLGFTHPRTRELVSFRSPMPDDMKTALEYLENSG